MLEFVLFLNVTLAFIIRHGFSANNNLREWKNACLAIVSELEAHKSLANDCGDNLGKLDEKLRQLNRKGYEQLDALIEHQNNDGKIGAKFRQGYSLFERRFQRPLLKAMDYCRKLERSTMDDKASLGENFGDLIGELRADINTLVPQLEMALMEEQLMEAFENGEKFYQTEKLEELIEKITQMQTELDTTEGPSYLVNFTLSFEHAKRELELLREQNANAESVEMAKVLCIVLLVGLEIRLDTVKNEFCAKIAAVPSMNVSKLSGIRHQFFEEWHQIADNCYYALRHRGTPSVDMFLKMQQWGTSDIWNGLELDEHDCHAYFDGCQTYSCVDEKGDQIFVVNSCVPDSGKCTHSDLDQICTKDGGTPKCEICYNGLCNKAKIELKKPLLKNVQKPNNPPKTGTDGAKNESSSEENGTSGAKNESSSEENGTSGAKNESSSTPAD